MEMLQIQPYGLEYIIAVKYIVEFFTKERMYSCASYNNIERLFQEKLFWFDRLLCCLNPIH